MPGAILTLTEREVEVMGYALTVLSKQHSLAVHLARGRGNTPLADDCAAKLLEVEALRWKLDAAPAAPLATWSDHDRNTREA